MKTHKEVWDKHWSKLSEEGRLLSKFLEFYRKQILSRGLAHYVEMRFPKRGIFLECGSGTSQTSNRIKKFERVMIALDISKVALEKNVFKNKDCAIQADIMKLPFKDESIDGIWNIGVMEHFSKQELHLILNEFHRVAAKGSSCILFWPLGNAPYQLCIRAVERVFRSLGKNIRIFPEEPSRLSSREEAMNLMKSHGFHCTVEYSIRDLFTFAVVMGLKSSL